MVIQYFKRVLLAAAAIPLAGFVIASPYSPHLNYLKSRELTLANTCTDWLVGQVPTTPPTQVCISVSGGTLTVSYPAVSGCTYVEEHVYIGTTKPTSTTPGQFPYKCTVTGTTASCPIPVSSFGKCNTLFYIATHATLSCPTSADPGATQTGWGKGTCINPNCKPWGQYWSFTPQCYCPTTSTLYSTITSTSTSEIPYTTTSFTTITSSSEILLTSTSYTTITSSSAVLLTSTVYTTITSTSSTVLVSTPTCAIV